MTLLSQAEYARRLGLSRAAITQWKQAGHLVMEGNKVNVELSDAQQKRNRRDGLPAVKASGITVMRGRLPLPPLVNLAELAERLPDVPSLALSCAAIERQLTSLDWRSCFEWGDEARRLRARLAARCVGLIAVESPLTDDGHWGGFQLRSQEDMGQEAGSAVVLAGYGFELSPAEVLHFCRTQVVVCRTDNCAPAFEECDDTAEVMPALLVLLAHPHFEGERHLATDR